MLKSIVVSLLLSSAAAFAPSTVVRLFHRSAHGSKVVTTILHSFPLCTLPLTVPTIGIGSIECGRNVKIHSFLGTTRETGWLHGR